VLGSEYVDAALDSASEFSGLFQELVTEVCWGTVWTRDGLPKKTRSLITVAIVVALKFPRELKTHVLGALRNGCTIAEIQEVLAHAAIYCGMPAGLIAFKAADEVIAKWQEENQ